MSNKVLFVSNTGNFSKFNIPFMKWFHEQNWIVDYASPCEEIVNNCDTSYKIPISRQPFSISNIKSIYLLSNIIKRNNYSIIHCHTPMGAVVTRLAALKHLSKGLKVIYTVHGFHFYKGSPLINWLLYFPIEKILSKYTDCLVTINNEDYFFSKKHLNINKIYKIDGVGVDLRLFKPISETYKNELRLQYGFASNDFILLYVAEFIPRKNHVLLFDVLIDLIKVIPSIKVVLCGKGILLDTFLQKINNSELRDYVFFMGYRKDVNQLYQISDLYVTTSKQEGFPISLIEAIATKVPIIATKIRGQIDVIEHEYNGLLYDIDRKDLLLKYIIRLYNNKNERFLFSNNAYERIKNYSVNTAVDNMSVIYKTVINNDM